jgi:hypothetical protein
MQVSRNMSLEIHNLTKVVLDCIIYLTLYCKNTTGMPRLKIKKLVKTHVSQYLQMSAQMYIQVAIIQLFMISKASG